MNFNDPSEFGKAFSRLVVDPAEIREAFEADQLAEDESAFDLQQAQVYRHPDGEHFEVAYVLENGERVTTTDRWISKADWLKCQPVPLSGKSGGRHA